MSAPKPDASTPVPSINRTPVIIALVLSLVLVAGVLIGARVLLGPASVTQVGMSAVDSPDADSAECSELLDVLPDEAFGHNRAQLVEPAPSGAAAWASSDLERVTLRCGVSLPMQYTPLSDTVDIEGTEWLPIIDATPGSDLETWYSINRFPVIAVTADSLTTDNAENPVDPFSEALATLPEQDNEPFEAPLVSLPSAGEPAECTTLIDALPSEFNATSDGDSPTYTRIDSSRLSEAGYGDDTVAWSADGQEPIVLRCGIEPSENYEAGAMLQQIDSIPWFEDTILASGTTSSAWYALGRTVDVVVSLPQAASQNLVSISGVIEENIPAE